MSEKKEISPEPEEKTADVDDLRPALEEAKKKAAEYYDQLLRLRAEFENFRRRVDKEKADARALGKQEVLVPLIEMVDIFQRALNHTQEAQDVKHVVQGVEMLHKSFARFLKAEGLEPIDAMGKTFDPTTMEAIDQIEADEDQVGKVVAEHQKGYRFQGRVLRPSLVRVGVARKKETQGKEQEIQEDNE